MRHSSAVCVVFGVYPSLRGLRDVVAGFSFVIGDVFLLPSVARCGGVAFVDAFVVEACVFAPRDVEGAQRGVFIAQNHAARIVCGGFAESESGIGTTVTLVDLDGLAIADGV